MYDLERHLTSSIASSAVAEAIAGGPLAVCYGRSDELLVVGSRERRGWPDPRQLPAVSNLTQPRPRSDSFRGRDVGAACCLNAPLKKAVRVQIDKLHVQPVDTPTAVRRPELPVRLNVSQLVGVPPRGKGRYWHKAKQRECLAAA